MLFTTLENETARRVALSELKVLDTEPEVEFESIVKAVAAACSIPVCLISILDENRFWFKASIGLSAAQETPRSTAFCTYTVQQEGLFEVDDCRLDERFCNNPLVVNEPSFVFYAGVPLRLKNGVQVGTLCVIDYKPRTLTEPQREVLLRLGDATQQMLEARRAVNSLSASESRFSELCAVSPLGIFSADANGVCTYCNFRLQQILGASQGQVIGECWWGNLHPDDREAVSGEWNKALTRRREFILDFRLLQADGRIVMAKVVTRPVFTAGNILVGHVGSVEDVTNYKTQLERQHRSVLLLRQTGALARVGGWELDLGDNIFFWSEQTCLMHGLEPGYQPRLEEALGFLMAESQVAMRTAIDDLVTQGIAMDIELQMCRTDGRCIWIRVVGEAERHSGQVIRLRGAVQDIDDLVSQRVALENAHNRMTMATESGEIGVWEWNIHSDQLEWSPQMHRLYGLEQSAGAKSVEEWNKLLHPDDRKRMKLALENALNGADELDCEFRIQHPDGSVHHLQSTGQIKRDKSGEPLTMLGVNWDVTPLRRLTSELAEQHELLHVTFQSIDDAVITADTDGIITWLNPAAERMTAWLCKDAVGEPIDVVYTIRHLETGLIVDGLVEECLRVGKKICSTHNSVLLDRHGVRYGVEDSASPILDKQGNLFGVVLVFRDVTEQRRLNREMTFRATHDELTQVFNRSEFEVRLTQALKSVRIEPSTHAMMFIDLDQFKLVNDACGHSVGDQLLKQMSSVLDSALRIEDTLARLGGDEFGVILKDCSAEEALAIAQDICDRVSDYRFIHGGRRFRIGASIGLVAVDDRWVDTAAIMQAADTSCYAAKEAGRNRVHVWFDTDQMIRARRGDMQWAARLEQSLDENCFELYAQKLISLDNSALGLNAEVLIRLREGNGKIILPGAFLHAAERFHMATRIDRWVLRKAIDTLQGLENLAAIDMLWVNLSGQSVGDPNFHRDAIQLLTEAGNGICRRVCLEITETAAVTNIADAAHFIDSLRSLGVRTALDDFGAGASSFGYLKGLPVDILKIDGQYIANLMDNPLDAAAVRCFVEVAAGIGLATVAEHVENIEVLERLRKKGVDFAQGFHLHKPEPIERVLMASKAMRVKEEA